jgi:cystathionine beta-lyase/cystathionine gamma-synthase
MQDIQAVANFARSRGIQTVIDNSWATPVFQNPLTLGVDIVVHTASKYLGGHSDVVAGALVASGPVARAVHERERAMLGGVIGPFESWLILRGIRTLGIRMQRHQQSALAVAAYLAVHPKVRIVHYPGLRNHPQHELGLRQMSGFSGLMSFELDSDLAGARRFVNALQFFKIGVSWGGFESLAVMPFSREAARHAPHEWEGLGIRATLVRIAVGLEDVEDLIADLEQALAVL